MNGRKHPVKRLHRLGRKLSLINMGISGAILVVIAMIALTIADRAIMQQGSRDLGLYVRAVHTLVAQSRVNILAQAVPTEGGAIGVEPAAESVPLESPPPGDVLLRLPERYQVYFNSDGEDTTARRLTNVPGVPLTAQEAFDLVEGEGPPHDARWVGGYTTTASVGGVGYRVSVSPVQQNGTLLVVQNVNEEIALRTRMRWLFGGLTVSGMVMIALASMHVSRQSIRPIEDSIRQQRQFVAAASHELRTPVTALNANAEVLADAPLGEYAPYLDSIRSVSERMTRLLQDLIDLARADAGELPIETRPIDASEAVTDALRWMRPLADKRGVGVHEAVDTAYLLGDAGRVRQVLVALMDNALRYTPQGGSITVTLKREGGHVSLSVADTGMGIPDDCKPRVFDRFYRTDEARDRESGGAGLGLSVVKQLTEGMRGSVAVGDNPGGGTVFTLRFKAAD